MKNPEPQHFNYRVSAKVRSVYPGAHVGQMVGAGQLFKRHVPLMASPDPRRIDLRASVLDPFNQYKIRVFQQASQLTVYLVADLSASMSFQGDTSKRQVLADCLLSIAESARQAGDRFGFVGCADSLEERFIVTPAGNSPGYIRLLAKALQTEPLRGKAAGLALAARHLPAQSALVFLLSDFHLPTARIEQVLQTLSHHFVVPLVVWDKQEYDNLPAWGSIRLRDMENGRQRILWLRPGLRQKIIGAFGQRQKKLLQVFRSFGCEPLFLEDGYRAEQLTQYFLRHSA